MYINSGTSVIVHFKGNKLKRGGLHYQMKDWPFALRATVHPEEANAAVPSDSYSCEPGAGGHKCHAAFTTVKLKLFQLHIHPQWPILTLQNQNESIINPLTPRCSLLLFSAWLTDRIDNDKISPSDFGQLGPSIQRVVFSEHRKNFRPFSANLAWLSIARPQIWLCHTTLRSDEDQYFPNDSAWLTKSPEFSPSNKTLNPSSSSLHVRNIFSNWLPEEVVFVLECRSGDFECKLWIIEAGCIHYLHAE